MPTLVVQRGHVPRRTGATGTAGEQEVVTAIAAELGKYKPAGWTLRIINADEPAERYKGDVFIALHCDGSTNTSASGASVGYQNSVGGALAAKWKSAYTKQGWRAGFRPDNYTAALRGYYGFKYAKLYTQAYFLIEHGFLTNKSDAAWIRSHYAECAKAIWDAVAGEQKEVSTVNYVYGVVVDMHDTVHRAALRSIAKKYNDKLVAGEVSVAYHAAEGVNTDAYINYAKANGLEHQSVTNGSHLHMVLRSKGAPSTTDQAEHIAKLKSQLHQVAQHARDILTIAQ